VKRLFFFLAFAFVSLTATAQTKYVLTDLGTLGGATLDKGRRRRPLETRADTDSRGGLIRARLASLRIACRARGVTTTTLPTTPT